VFTLTSIFNDISSTLTIVANSGNFYENPSPPRVPKIKISLGKPFQISGLMLCCIKENILAQGELVHYFSN